MKLVWLLLLWCAWIVSMIQQNHRFICWWLDLFMYALYSLFLHSFEEHWLGHGWGRGRLPVFPYAFDPLSLGPCSRCSCWPGELKRKRMEASRVGCAGFPLRRKKQRLRDIWTLLNVCIYYLWIINAISLFHFWDYSSNKHISHKPIVVVVMPSKDNQEPWAVWPRVAKAAKVYVQSEPFLRLAFQQVN